MLLRRSLLMSIMGRVALPDTLRLSCCGSLKTRTTALPTIDQLNLSPALMPACNSFAPSIHMRQLPRLRATLRLKVNSILVFIGLTF